MILRRALNHLCVSLSVLATLLSPDVSAANCQGKFVNPITDICWSCAFPISLGGRQMLSMNQEDTENPSNTVCACGNPPRVGLSTAFWEPARQVDVTRNPYCMVSLGGVTVDAGITTTMGEIRQHSESLNKSSFWHAHWYLNPLMYWLGLVLDDRCLEQTGFDIAYITEIDPTWSDSELTLILTPEAFLFGGPLAAAACAADCVSSTAGFGATPLYWCAGCNGLAYPMNGYVQAHISRVQASSLIVQRMTAKMHREMLMWAASGSQGQCGYYPQPVMDKSNYKFQMTYPVAQTDKLDGKCCQPYGRTTLIWGAGKEIPFAGEDLSYMVFRKRNCCAGVTN